MGRLIVISGPSCIGKGPLCAALGKFYPELLARMRKLVLYNSRAPRPAEVDGVEYHFRTRAEIEALRSDDRFVVLDVRGDLQALDRETLRAALSAGDVYFEGNPFVGRDLQTCPLPADAERLSIFLSPLSREEILFLRQPERNISLEALVADLMRSKLLRRTTRQKGRLSLRDLEDIERRATSAYAEMKNACHFDHVVPNHDGEDSENWSGFYYPIADARRTLLAVVDLLEGRKADGAETWEPDLLP